jgi:hypothetical protein
MPHFKLLIINVKIWFLNPDEEQLLDLGVLFRAKKKHALFIIGLTCILGNSWIRKCFVRQQYNPTEYWERRLVVL